MARRLALTVREAARRGLGVPGKRRRKMAPKPSNTHTWAREGRGLRCTGCTMWLPLWALPEWAHGAWEAALHRGAG
jgi:hypothetical protein